jgi:hypothetical protein
MVRAVPDHRGQGGKKRPSSLACADLSVEVKKKKKKRKEKKQMLNSRATLAVS